MCQNAENVANSRSCLDAGPCALTVPHTSRTRAAILKFVTFVFSAGTRSQSTLMRLGWRLVLFFFLMPMLCQSCKTHFAKVLTVERGWDVSVRLPSIPSLQCVVLHAASRCLHVCNVLLSRASPWMSEFSWFWALQC